MELKPYTEAIKRKINLVEFVGSHIELKQKAGKYVACCPFHNEKTPSFYVHADYFHCFGCQKHGDVFTFSTDFLGKKFWETLKELGDKTGVELPNQKEETSEQKKRRAAQARFFKALSDTWTFFDKALQSYEPAKSYLLKRGYSQEEITSYPFGYAPSEGQPLYKELQEKGHKLEDLITLGLCRPSKRGNGHYDFFRDRVMIRIDDEYGRPVAFGGRSFGAKKDQGPKYINSPAHPLFKKGELLFNFYAAKPTIQKKKRAILCEGYMDVLKLVKSGLEECVAVLGTAAGLPHLELIEKYADNLVVVFDGDEAGMRACKRLAPMVAQCKHMRVQLLQLPDEHDPDSYIEEFGAEKLKNDLEKAPEFLDVVIEAELEDASQRPPGEMIDFLRKSAFVWMQGIKDPMHRDWMFGKIAKQTGIDKTLIMRGANSSKVGTTTGTAARYPAMRNMQNTQNQPATQGIEKSTAEDTEQTRAQLRMFANLRKNPILRAVVGALMFAGTEDLELGATKNWIDSNLEVPAAVMEALFFLLDKGDGNSAANQLTLDLITTWEGQLLPQKPQFEGRAREQMREVAIRIRQLKLKSTIADLKKRLRQASEPEVQQQLALEIQNLERSRT